MKIKDCEETIERNPGCIHCIYFKNRERYCNCIKRIETKYTPIYGNHNFMIYYIPIYDNGNGTCPEFRIKETSIIKKIKSFFRRTNGK